MWSRFLSLLKMTLKVRVSLEIYANGRRNCGTFRVLTSVWLNLPVQLPAQVHPLPLRGVDWKGWRVVWRWAELQKCLCREKWWGWEGKAGDRGDDDRCPHQQEGRAGREQEHRDFIPTVRGKREPRAHARDRIFFLFLPVPSRDPPSHPHQRISSWAFASAPAEAQSALPRMALPHSLPWQVLATVSAAQWELPGRDPLSAFPAFSFSRALIIIGLTSHHTFLFASCLLPLLERKQEGRYFYLSDALLWPQPLE